MTITLEAKERTRMNASALRKLRESGRLPAVVFGRGSDNYMIHLSESQFRRWLRSGASGAVELVIEGKKRIPVLLEDMQRDPVTRNLIHIDFQSIQSDTPVRTKIPVKFIGTPEAARQGGVVLVQSSTVEVEALPALLPNEIEYDIGDMKMGDVVQVKDIRMPEGVTVISDPEEALLSVSK